MDNSSHTRAETRRSAEEGEAEPPLVLELRVVALRLPIAQIMPGILLSLLKEHLKNMGKVPFRHINLSDVWSLPGAKHHASEIPSRTRLLTTSLTEFVSYWGSMHNWWFSMKCLQYTQTRGRQEYPRNSGELLQHAAGCTWINWYFLPETTQVVKASH